MAAVLQSVPLESIDSFTELLNRELSAGRPVTLTHHGERIAMIEPRGPEPTQEQREAARERLLALMNAGLDWGGPYTYDERHER